MYAKLIVIVGGGIGGLTAALALQRRGFRVAVYERASVLREIGAGLIVAPNARRALRDLGIDHALAAISCCIPVGYLCNYASGEIVATRPRTNIRVTSRHLESVLLGHIENTASEACPQYARRLTRRAVHSTLAATGHNRLSRR